MSRDNKREEVCERTCVSCRQHASPDELERFVLMDGHLVHDVRRKAPGRGAWVQTNRQCLDRALRGGFQRSFKRKLEAPPLDELVEQMQSAIQTRLKQTLQVGVRARQLAIGAIALSEAMKEGSVKLALIAPDAGKGTHSKFLANAQRKGIDVYQDLEGSQLGSWLGREFVAVVGVTNVERAIEIRRDLDKLRALSEV